MPPTDESALIAGLLALVGLLVREGISLIRHFVARRNGEDSSHQAQEIHDVHQVVIRTDQQGTPLIYSRGNLIAEEQAELTEAMREHFADDARQQAEIIRRLDAIERLMREAR